MSSLKKKSFLFVGCLAIVCTSYWYMTEPYRAEVVYQESEPLTVNGEGKTGGKSGKNACKFPDFDPFNPHAMKYYEKFPTSSCHKGMPTITSYNGEVIKFNKTHKQMTLKSQKIQCWYRIVSYQRRVEFFNGAWVGPFNDDVKVPDRPEYVEVKCTNEKGKQVSRMHHYIVRKEERKKSKPPKHRQFKDANINVILLGMDSLASHLFKRAMPKTRDYLIQNLDAIEMNKYNKVGDNTFPNLLAITAGVYAEDLKNWTLSEGFDKVPYLWKQFRKAGYRTQYMSDRPDFDDFLSQPTDSYNVPMLRSLMKDKVQFDNNCFEDKIEVKLWLDLILEFARESLFTTGRFFSVGMIKRPTHDFPNQASAVDEHYLHFFQELNDTGLLNNTFLVFFGDHGPRMSAYRRTFYGSIEERAASMVIRVPPWFKNKYPTHFNNLKTNKDRLTSNFDIHETVQNILFLPATSAKTSDIYRSKTGVNRAISLFSAIPPERTCDDASLTPHMCMCNGGVNVFDDGIKQQVGLQVIRDINSILEPKSSLCVTLNLKSVTYLSLLSGKVGRTAMYRIMLTSEPGDAMFEATVQYTSTLYFFTSVKTLGLISRINMYRGQSDCVNDDKVSRMYCYCKDVLAKNPEAGNHSVVS